MIATILFILAVTSLAFAIYAFIDKQDTTAFLSLFLCLILTVTLVVNISRAKQTECTRGIEVGEKVYLKNLEKPFITVSSRCEWSSIEKKMVTQYTVASDAGLSLEVSEKLLERR